MLRVCSVLVMMALYRMGCMLQDALIGTCVLSGRLEQSALHRYVMGLTSSATAVVASPAYLIHHEDSCPRPASHGLVSKINQACFIARAGRYHVSQWSRKPYAAAFTSSGANAW